MATTLRLAMPPPWKSSALHFNGRLTKRVPTERRSPIMGLVTNGRADNMCGTSEVLRLAAPLCASRNSAEVGDRTRLREWATYRGVGHHFPDQG
jgi:hypothetical protein